MWGGNFVFVFHINIVTSVCVYTQQTHTYTYICFPLLFLEVKLKVLNIFGYGKQLLSENLNPVIQQYKFSEILGISRFSWEL